MSFQADFFARHPQAQSVMGLFDVLPGVSFYAKDRHSRFIRVNDSFLQNHGLRDAADVIGKTDLDLSPPAMAMAYMEEDQRVMTSGQPLPGQVWMVYQSRRVPRWYISSKTPLFDPDGTVIGIAGAMYAIDRPDELARHVQELMPVIRHIERHYAEPVPMSAMAKLAGLSSTHFNRRFQQLLRMTPMAYLKMVRVHAAQRLLTTTSLPLSQIAIDAGFTDQSHFTRRFRQSTGLTPAAYRKRFRA